MTNSIRRVRSAVALTFLVSASASLITANQARAACAPSPTPGNDVITCTGPASLPGSLQAGSDIINLNSGVLTGSTTGFSGEDTFNLNGATVNGTLFGGEAGAADNVLLNDTFNLTSGVVNAPGSGDAIVGERGDDTINIGTGVAINGNVSGSQGADIINMTGGTVTGSIFGEGTTFFNVPVPTNDDQITISGNSLVTGMVSGGQGNDTVTIQDNAVVQGNIGQAIDEEGDDLTTLLGNSSVGGVTDLAGNNSLVMGPGGNPTIVGAVSYGAGNDSVTIHSGAINGPGIAVNTGDGNDTFTMDGGVVANTVQQGSGTDDFVMSGGQIGALFQGDGLDTFNMSAGRIVGAFEDGDFAVMTGGQIGRVDMKLDDNTFDMSGGSIDGNLVTGFGNDTIILSNGTIGGNISVSGGTDSVTVTGGHVFGEVRMSTGNDVFTWDGGGVIDGAIDLAGDNDTAVLRNLTSANLGTTPLLSGGTGIDSLTFENVATGGIARFQGWETVDVTNGSELTLDGDLVLGDPGTTNGTGALSVDATSTLLAGGGFNPSIMPAVDGELVSVTNAGLFDLTNGGSGPSDRLRIVGDYVGDDGRIALETRLGDDASDSDRLVISTGRASGATVLDIQKAGGEGDLTTGNGILVVNAVDGGRTSDAAFFQGGALVAGPYEYTLQRGSVDDSNNHAWYLRSTAPIEPSGEPEPPPDPPTEIDEEEVYVPPPIPDSVAEDLVEEFGDDPIPYYRKEVSLYTAVPPLTILYGGTLLDTLHERVGDEEQLRARADLAGNPFLNGAWARIIGQHGEEDGDDIGIYGDGPKFDYDFALFQFGADIYRAERASGWRDHAGLYAAIGSADSDVKHFDKTKAGSDSFDGYSIGAYWTQFSPQGWYLDAVLQGTWYADVEASSTTGENLDTDGFGFAASLEGGVPIKLGGGVIVEPQAQLVYQGIDLDSARDSASRVRFDDIDSLAGRIGARLASTWNAGSQTDPRLITAWFRANLWNEFLGDPKTRFSSGDGFVSFQSDISGAWVDLNLGVTAQVSRTVSLYANAGYQVGLDGESEGYNGKAGLRANW